MTTAFEGLPLYDDLPLDASAPADSNWGVFGERDELGCLNFLSPEGVVAAAGLVRDGKVFRLDTRLGFNDPPFFGRAQVRHTIVKLGEVSHDDVIDNFNTQEGSQWDGLAHYGLASRRAFYNGVAPEEVRSGPGGRLSIHNWADKMVGRGVLIDVYGWRLKHGRAVDPLTDEVYTLEEIKAALSEQAGRITPGSMLLVRTGWLETLQALSVEERRTIAAQRMPPVIGLEPSREMAAWLWDNRVAALGVDNTSVEPLPMRRDAEGRSFHERALPMLGLPLGEIFVLAPLAEDCARDGRYEFMLVSCPLNLEGGVASPPNAVAIK